MGKWIGKRQGRRLGNEWEMNGEEEWEINGKLMGN